MGHTKSSDIIAFVDGVQAAPGEARIDVTDPSVIRGDGVFEVVRLYAGIPLALGAHLRRLEQSAAAMRLSVPTDRLYRDIRLAVSAAEGQDRTVRIIVTAAERVVILVEHLQLPPADAELLPVEHKPSPLLVGVKSLSYGANMVAARLAREAGCWQALFIDPDTRLVTEAPIAAFAWSENGRVMTPPLSDGILDSITRRMLLEAGAAEEQSCPVDRLREAEGAALVGTTFELYPVAGVRGIARFEEEANGLTQAARILKDRIRASLQHADPLPGLG